MSDRDPASTAGPLSEEELIVARRARGFMPDDEGVALAAAAASADVALGPFLEVGSYCGKSACYLGPVARRSGTVVYCVDHHRGSEENQPGWEWHEPDLVDPGVGRIDTLPHFRRTVHEAGLEDVAVAVVGQSTVVARHWATSVSLLFIDGGHGVEPARLDYEGWTPKVAAGGLLVVHDVFTDPAEGGQAPHEQIYRPALESGRFVEVAAVGSLRVMRRA
ncbi:MAG: class I SAM-dependent methyltransferase [Acidimicrobiales bacterium]